MMSRLRHAQTLADDRAPELKIDRHASDGVTVDYSPRRPPPYWRLTDPTFNLIGLGVAADTGRLVAFDLARYNGPPRPPRPRAGVTRPFCLG